MKLSCISYYVKRRLIYNGKIPRTSFQRKVKLRYEKLEIKIRRILRHLLNRSVASRPADTTSVHAENRVKVKVNRSLLLSKGQDVYMCGAEWRHYNKWRWFCRKRKKKEVLRTDAADCFNSWKNLITATIHLRCVDTFLIMSVEVLLNQSVTLDLERTGYILMIVLYLLYIHFFTMRDKIAQLKHGKLNIAWKQFFLSLSLMTNVPAKSQYSFDNAVTRNLISPF